MICQFCDNPDVLGRTIYRDGLVWAFPTNIPIVPGHILICPVRCVAEFDSLTNEELAAIKILLIKIKSSLKNIFGAEGFHCVWNEGEVAGQSVKHFHLHIVPRKFGDEGITEYEPRKFLYRPGSRNISPDEELQEVAQLVKNDLI